MELPPAAPTPKQLTRTGIMLSLLPALTGALNAIPEVNSALCCPSVPEAAGTVRRVFRAIVTIALKMALNAGMPVPVVINQMQAALLTEMAERKTKAEQEGATQAPATLPS